MFVAAGLTEDDVEALKQSMVQFESHFGAAAPEGSSEATAEYYVKNGLSSEPEA